MPRLPDEGSGPAGARFRLIRYFSLTSLLGLAVVTLALLGALRFLAEGQLVDHEGRANADQTRAFANALWERHRSYITVGGIRSAESLRSDARHAALDADVRRHMRGLRIAKVKIYDLQGLTVYSTDPAQVGEDRGSNPGFRSAAQGLAVSDITFREEFDAFEGHLSKRNLIASYVPVRVGPQEAIEGVFEVYSDVTELLEHQRRRQWQLAGLVLGLLATLYTFLHLVVRKADRILERQAGDAAERERRMRHQAYHDALTGLPNRAAFHDQMRQAIALATRRRQAAALMFIDLDRFKLVNDSLGHLSGDAVLRLAAQRIKACLRASDSLYRMGGDEFTVILPEVAVPEDVALVAHRILEAMALPATVHDHELVVGASIGIAAFPGDGSEAETLLRNADAALYKAKEAGRGRHAFYEPEMNRRALQRLDLEVALKHAVRDGEFTVHYLPRVAVPALRVVCVEALLRWDRPGEGLIDPLPQLRTLDDSGLSALLGSWLLREACAQARRWREQGLAPLRVAVAVAAQPLRDPGLVEQVRQALNDNGLPGEALELELDEAVLAAPGEVLKDTLSALKALGLRLSIGRTGASLSALAAAAPLPIDAVHIELGPEPARRNSVTGALIGLARSLGLRVVCGGVLSQDEAAGLAQAGCNELQGPCFGAPMAASRVPQALAAQGAPASA
jgi:diguanylate cyclase (GGDEF)-like protein